MGKKGYIIIDQNSPGDAWEGHFRTLKEAMAHIEKKNRHLETIPPTTGKMVSDYQFIIEVEVGEHILRPDGPAWFLKELRDRAREWRKSKQKRFW